MLELTRAIRHELMHMHVSITFTWDLSACGSTKATDVSDGAAGAGPDEVWVPLLAEASEIANRRGQ